MTGFSSEIEEAPSEPGVVVAALARIVPTLLLIAIVLAAWEGAARLLHLPAFVLPAPSAIAAVMVVRATFSLRRW